MTELTAKKTGDIIALWIQRYKMLFPPFFEDLLIKNKKIDWTSFCFLDIQTAIQVISGAMDIVKIYVSPGDDFIQSRGFNIRFYEKITGCDLYIHLWEKTDDSFKFLYFWAYLQSKRTVMGGDYKDEFAELTIEKRSSREEKARQDLLKTLDSIPDRNKRYSPRLMKYAVIALNRSGKSPENFYKVSISTVAQLLEDERNQVITTFKQECPDPPKEFNPDYVGLDLYCNADTLGNWARKINKKQKISRK